MAKISNTPITAADLLDFAENHSDLHFEMEVGRALWAEFDADHGGTYVDPYLNKPRQFDFRARKFDVTTEVRLAIECKNLSENAPLLVSCVSRAFDESYHEIIGNHSAGILRDRVKRCSDVYEHQFAVGKTIDQVARLNDGQLSGGDKDVYDKWAKAISSAHDLVRESFESIAASVVIPVLVVPNDRLWHVVYDTKGRMRVPPTATERIAYFIGRLYSLSDDYKYTASHLEIMTLSGLKEFLKEFGHDGQAWSTFFGSQP